MSFHVHHWWGEQEDDYPVENLGDLYDELSLADAEHPDVSVTHESEWCVTATRSGHVVLENLEDDEPVYEGVLDREHVIALMRLVAEGRIDEARRSMQ